MNAIIASSECTNEQKKEALENIEHPEESKDTVDSPERDAKEDPAKGE